MGKRRESDGFQQPPQIQKRHASQKVASRRNQLSTLPKQEDCVSTDADQSIPRRASADNRATEIADLLARLAILMSKQSPGAEAPVPQPIPLRVLLTVEEAAERLHIGKTKTYALVKAGEIESVLIGRLRRIHIDAINSYAARLTSQQATINKAA
jgi:excisionase family DNA binding protein